MKLKPPGSENLPPIVVWIPGVGYITATPGVPPPIREPRAAAAAGDRQHAPSYRGAEGIIRLYYIGGIWRGRHKAPSSLQEEP